KALTPAKRRALVTRLAHRVMAEINRATAVTPGAVVAMALLNHARRGMSDGELLAMSARLTKMLKGLGARISKSHLDPSGELREQGVHDAAHLFMDAEMIVATVPGEGTGGARSRRAKIYTGPDVMYVVPDEKRLSLDLSKNIIVHFFVPRALVATALLTPPNQPEMPSPPASTAPPAPGPAMQAIVAPQIGPHAVSRAMLEDRVQKLSR